MTRIPGMKADPRVVRTPFRCTGCGEVWVHFEAMPWDDEPCGLGPWAFCPECGGRLERVIGA